MGARVVQGDKGFTTRGGHARPPDCKPARRHSGTHGALIEFADVLPTLAEAARVDSARYGGTDGMSLYPALTTDRAHPREWIYQRLLWQRGLPLPAAPLRTGRKLYATGAPMTCCATLENTPT